MTTLSIATLFEGLPGGLLVTDTTSRVLYANRAVEQRTGYMVAEIIGKKPGELWGGRMPRSFYQALWNRLDREGQPFVGRFENVRKDGARINETLQIAPIKNAFGTTEYFVEIHPVLATSEEERSFHQGFLREAGEWHRDPSTWQRFFVSLGRKFFGDSVDEAIPPWTGAPGSLSGFVAQELILPTQMNLARRFEDAALIRSAQADPAAFAFLYEKYSSLLRHYFARRVGDQGESDDLTQEVFVRAWRALPRFRVTNASYYTYLLHIAHNILVDYYRGHDRSCTCQSETIDLMAGEAVFPDLDTLDTLLSTLSPTERSVMLLTYQDGYRAREVAEKLGKTENAIKLILSRSRKKLRDVLS